MNEARTSPSEADIQQALADGQAFSGAMNKAMRGMRAPDDPRAQVRALQAEVATLQAKLSEAQDAAQRESEAVLAFLLDAARNASTEKERGWIAVLHRSIETGRHRVPPTLNNGGEAGTED